MRLGSIFPNLKLLNLAESVPFLPGVEHLTAFRNTMAGQALLQT